MDMRVKESKKGRKKAKNKDRELLELE